MNIATNRPIKVVNGSCENPLYKYLTKNNNNNNDIIKTKAITEITRAFNMVKPKHNIKTKNNTTTEETNNNRSLMHVLFGFLVLFFNLLLVHILSPFQTTSSVLP